jgi:hypothetical protein
MDVRQTLGIALVLAATLGAPLVAGWQSAARWLIIVDDLHLDSEAPGISECC